MNTTELRTATSIRSKFAKDRHKEKVELCNLRFGQAIKLIGRRDKYAKDRHAERVDLMQ